MALPSRWFIQLHITLYRLTGGILGGNLLVARILLLTTTGRKSGKPRTTPLRYLQQNDTYLIVASNWGKPQPPAWFYNVQANPNVTLQVMGKRLSAQAEIASGAQNDALYAKFVEADSSFDQYRRGVQRTIPVIILHPLNNA